MLTLNEKVDINVSTILIRKSYVDLFDDYISKQVHTLVLRNPGIGKLTFLHYVLKQFLESCTESTCFLLGSAKNAIYMCYMDGEVKTLGNDASSILNFVAKEKSRDIYYLFDCGTKQA